MSLDRTSFMLDKALVLDPESISEEDEELDERSVVARRVLAKKAKPWRELEQLVVVLDLMDSFS